jgi:hypothetical protein
MRKWRSADVLTHRTLFLVSAIFSNDQTRCWDIDDLSALDVTGWNCVHIVLAGFTVLNVLLQHFIWGRRPSQARSWMSWLPSRWLLALLAQAFRLADKTIRGRRQVTIVAVFGQLLLQRFHLPGQLFDLLLLQAVLLFQQADVLLLLINQFLLQATLLSQQAILFPKLDQFFFCCHALTLHGPSAFGKSLGDLGSYKSDELSSIAYLYGSSTTASSPGEYPIDLWSEIYYSSALTVSVYS